jgi:hypothetical protein
MIQLLIGVLLGYGLHRSMKRAGLSLFNSRTRMRAIAVMTGFYAVATVLLELTDVLTR